MAHILITEARFYNDIADQLLQGAISTLAEKGHSYDVVTVPGCFELPAAIAMAVTTGRYNGYLALGCVIRGETSHYDYVCAESARGLNELAIHHHLALGFGIITANTKEQAYARCTGNDKHFGKKAALACHHMLGLKHQFFIQA